MVSESGPVSANDSGSFRAFEMEDQTWRNRGAGFQYKKDLYVM